MKMLIEGPLFVELRKSRKHYEHEYERPIELVVDGNVIAEVHYVNGPPFVEVREVG